MQVEVAGSFGNEPQECENTVGPIKLLKQGSIQ